MQTTIVFLKYTEGVGPDIIIMIITDWKKDKKWKYIYFLTST